MATLGKRSRDGGMTNPRGWAICPAMINRATSYWYFSYDSSLAVGGSRAF
jgi:hypothetical protein